MYSGANKLAALSAPAYKPEAPPSPNLDRTRDLASFDAEASLNWFQSKQMELDGGASPTLNSEVRFADGLDGRASQPGGSSMFQASSDWGGTANSHAGANAGETVGASQVQELLDTISQTKAAHGREMGARITAMYEERDAELEAQRKAHAANLEAYKAEFQKAIEVGGRRWGQSVGH
jgi:hypothetical protein